MRICDYCGEYEHDCKCKAGQTIAKLTAELEQLKCANGEMREALEGMSELCGNYFDESGLVCTRDKEIWALHLKVLSATSSTPPTPTIPIDVAEKMYEALQNLMLRHGEKHGPDTDYNYSCPICIALSLAKEHGLGKDKP